MSYSLNRNYSTYNNNNLELEIMENKSPDSELNLDNNDSSLIKNEALIEFKKIIKVVT